MNEPEKLFGSLNSSEKMPILFIGHGSPMNAIEENEITKKWAELGRNLLVPQAILCISAHWLTSGTLVTSMEKPRTIHDFGGFPDELFRQQYPAPGSPELAASVITIQTEHPIKADFEWGLDHGTWAVLQQMFPLANIPVVQLSINYSKAPEFHFMLARQLSKLREKGVLIIGSGNIVHNLRQLRFSNEVPDWAFEFDAKIAGWIETGDDRSIIDFQRLGSIAQIAHPTYDHLLPLLYTLGMKSDTDQIEFFNSEFHLGSISMRSVIWK